MSSLAERAAAVLRANDRGTYTVPSPRLYPHQWAWDSAFAAVGWATLDPARAVVELESLLAGQWEDGRIPHIRFHATSTDYFPGPGVWGCSRTSTITQPPVGAIAARRVFARGADPGAVRALLPALDRSHHFFHAHRDPLGWSCVAVVHPWESGLDNSPAWDESLEAVDPSLAPSLQRVDIEHVADAGQRPTDDQYRRYLGLVRSIREGHFGPGSGFAVYDPFNTALLARAEGDLAWLCERLDHPSEAADRAVRIRRALTKHLWDDRLGRFRYYDARARRWLTPDVLAAYGPLMLDPPPSLADRMLDALRREYWTEWPLPSTAPGSPAFDSRRYWRGPTWINVNWLLAPAVGTDLVDRSLALVDRSGFREYFDPHSGEGLGADTFTWTAALTLDLLL